MVEPRLERAAEVVERRLEQAAEEARSRPAKTGIPRRHSGAGPPAWMQVVEPRRERAAEESSGLDKPFRPPLE